MRNKKPSKIDLQKFYDQDLHNRHFVYKNVNFEHGIKYEIRLVILVLVLIVKTFISRLFRSHNPRKAYIFLSWGPLHTKRAKDLNEHFDLVEYYRNSFSKTQIRFFSKVSIKRLFHYLWAIRKTKTPELESSPYAKDSFLYRFLFVLDFLVIEGILEGVDKVAIAGYNDRVSVIISKLCEIHGIHISMLQHGVLGKKERWKHLKADRFFYLYPFSKPYVKHQIEVTDSCELIYLPKKGSQLDLKAFEKGKFDKNLAYATSPADSEKDLEILKTLKNNLVDKKYNLLIYPHPIEKMNLYKPLEDKKSVFITRERHGNISYLISRYSTLGIDYHEKGITPVFLNYEKHNMDFLEYSDFLTFESPTDFEKWINHSL